MCHPPPPAELFMGIFKPSQYEAVLLASHALMNVPSACLMDLHTAASMLVGRWRGQHKTWPFVFSMYQPGTQHVGFASSLWEPSSALS